MSVTGSAGSRWKLTISSPRDDLKLVILEAYRAMGSANQAISAIYSFRPSLNTPQNEASSAVCAAGPKVLAARDELLRFLSSEL